MVVNLLLQTEALIEDFCQQLHDLLQLARERQQSLEIEARQLRRFLDELEVRWHLTQEGDPLGTVDADQLQTTQEATRQQERHILEALAEAEENARRLELLLRQVEMSGRSLRSEAHARSYDPWELALRSQALHGREQERRALAREVHDGPAQVLSNLAMGLERCRHIPTQEDEEARTLLESMLRDTRLGLQEVRRFIYDLRPSPLASEPLNRQIERYIRDLESAYQLKVEYRWGGSPRDFSPEETVVIYRIVQEALQNARKHARADKITVDAYVEPTGWIIRVEDNGVGFDTNVPWDREDHWGIVGMRERARIIGADLRIESRQGEGTIVLLSLPLRPENWASERP